MTSVLILTLPNVCDAIRVPLVFLGSLALDLGTASHDHWKHYLTSTQRGQLEINNPIGGLWLAGLAMCASRGCPASPSDSRLQSHGAWTCSAVFPHYSTAVPVSNTLLPSNTEHIFPLISVFRSFCAFLCVLIYSHTPVHVLTVGIYRILCSFRPSSTFSVLLSRLPTLLCVTASRIRKHTEGMTRAR